MVSQHVVLKARTMGVIVREQVEALASLCLRFWRRVVEQTRSHKDLKAARKVHLHIRSVHANCKFKVSTSGHAQGV